MAEVYAVESKWGTRICCGLYRCRGSFGGHRVQRYVVEGTGCRGMLWRIQGMLRRVQGIGITVEGKRIAMVYCGGYRDTEVCCGVQHVHGCRGVCCGG